jgi:hypothetical protein
MRYTGLDGRPLSRIGLGTWAMGGGGYLASLGEQSDADSHAVIAAAVEAGINWLVPPPTTDLATRRNWPARHSARCRRGTGQ